MRVLAFCNGQTKKKVLLVFVPVVIVIAPVATGTVPVASSGKSTMGSANAVPDRRPHHMARGSLQAC